MRRDRPESVGVSPADEFGAYAGVPGPGVGTLAAGSRYYRRPVERILDDIHERLLREPVDARDVNVRVQGGDIVLEGTVPTKPDSWLIERVCDGVLGVAHVENRLRVRTEADAGERPAPEPISRTHWTPLG
jgi:hypothetical protein